MSANIPTGFVRSAQMNVSFNGSIISIGATLKPSMIIQPPTVELQGKPDTLYTLILMDPAGAAEYPIRKEYFHWIVTDIPGTGTVEQGKEILPYQMTTSQNEIHPYYFILYEQLSPLVLEPPADGAMFDLTSLISMNKLGPQSIMFFCAEKEPVPGSVVEGPAVE